MHRRHERTRIRFTESDAQHHVRHICCLGIVSLVLSTPMCALLEAAVSRQFADWITFVVSVCCWIYFVFCFDLRKIEGPSNLDDDFLRITGQSYSKYQHIGRCGIYSLLYIVALASMVGMVFSAMPYRYFARHRRKMYGPVNATLTVLFAAGLVPRFECRYLACLYDCGGAWIAQSLVNRTGRVVSFARLWTVILTQASSESFLAFASRVTATFRSLMSDLQRSVRQIARNPAALLVAKSKQHGCPIQSFAPYAVTRRSEYLPKLANHYAPSEPAIVA